MKTLILKAYKGNKFSNNPIVYDENGNVANQTQRITVNEGNEYKAFKAHGLADFVKVEVVQIVENSIKIEEKKLLAPYQDELDELLKKPKSANQPTDLQKIVEEQQKMIEKQQAQIEAMLKKGKKEQE